MVAGPSHGMATSAGRPVGGNFAACSSELSASGGVQFSPDLSNANSRELGIAPNSRELGSISKRGAVLLN